MRSTLNDCAARREPNDRELVRSARSDDDREVHDIFVAGAHRSASTRARVPPGFEQGIESPREGVRFYLTNSTRIGAGPPPRVPPLRGNRPTEDMVDEPSVRFDMRHRL